MELEGGLREEGGRRDGCGFGREGRRFEGRGGRGRGGKGIGEGGSDGLGVVERGRQEGSASDGQQGGDREETELDGGPRSKVRGPREGGGSDGCGFGIEGGRFEGRGGRGREEGGSDVEY